MRVLKMKGEVLWMVLLLWLMITAPLVSGAPEGTIDGMFLEYVCVYIFECACKCVHVRVCVCVCVKGSEQPTTPSCI